MANEEHLARLRQGVDAWNQWRSGHPGTQPDLHKADLSEVNLPEVNLREANLQGADLQDANFEGADLREANLRDAILMGVDLALADLRGADLRDANLRGADLHKANLSEANLQGAHLSDVDIGGVNLREANLRDAYLQRVDLMGVDLALADLRGADLRDAYLRGADLSGADLSGADLRAADLGAGNLRRANLSKANLGGARLEEAILVETNFKGANLSGCRVYGISAWNINVSGTQQSDLLITPENEPVITVDNLEVAQFIYLLLHNEKIREVINTITSKAVLILGRFTPERKAVLDAIREELRHRNYLPILFDFKAPRSRDFTETISTLAHMARFIIADITDAKSIPQELERIVPGLPSVPVQPLLHISASEYDMFEHFTRYPWVLKICQYDSTEEMIASLFEKVIAPAELKAKELLGPVRG
jgi:uncharacterized protein YjbI with pentapeptide repeats